MEAVGRKQKGVEQLSESPCMYESLNMIADMRIKHVPVEVTYSPYYNTGPSNSDEKRRSKENVSDLASHPVTVCPELLLASGQLQT
jgi:hypothetical protein